MSNLLRLLVSVCLLAGIAWKVDWTDVGVALTHLQPAYWLAAVGLLLLSQVASARRWQLFARELHFERSIPQLFCYYLIGMCFNLVLPTSVGGDIVRALYIEGNSRRRLAAFAAVFLDRLSGLLVLIALACGAALLSPQPLEWWIMCSVWGVAGAAVLGLAAVPLVLRWRVLPLPHQHRLQTVVNALRSPRALGEATALSLFVQSANVLVVWLLGVALVLPVPSGYYWVIVPMVSLLTLLPTVGGTGVREWGMYVFLAPVGVDAARAVTLSILWFAVNVTVSLIGGVVYLCGAFPRPGAAPSSEGEGADGSVSRDPDQEREGQLDQAA
jgi:uncharacterized membrane protein YbhN (UPF0104 family)